MPAIPTEEFAATLRDLDHAGFARLVAALWDADGWETAVDLPVVTASTETADEQLLVLPPTRFQRLQPVPETDHPVDYIVTPHVVGDSALPGNAPDVPVIGPEELRNRLLYALNSEQATAIATEFLDIEPRGDQWEPQDPVLERVRSRAASAVEPAESHVSRRAALGTLGLSVVAGAAWLATNDRGQADEPENEPDSLDDGPVSTPEASVPETASFRFDVQDGTVTITHDGGEPIAAGQLVIRNDGLDIPGDARWSELTQLAPGDVVSEGDSVSVDGSEWFDITVVLDREDEQEQLSEFSQGTDPSEIDFVETPRATFRFEYDRSSQQFVLNYVDGNVLRAADLVVRGTGFDGAPDAGWPELAESNSPVVRPGDTLALTQATPAVTARLVWTGDDERHRLLGQGYGPRRPRDESVSGVFSDRYDPQNSGYAGNFDPGRFPFATWEFEDEYGFGEGTAVQDGVIVVGGRGGAVYGLDAVDGTRLWQETISGSTGGTPVVTDGTVYVRQFARDQTGIVALDLHDGTPQWRVAVPQRKIGQPVVADGSLALATTGGPAATSVLHSFDTDSSLPNWSRTFEEFVFPAYTAFADGTIYTASTDALVAVEAESGRERWRFEQPDDFEGSFWGPMVVNDSLFGFLLGDRELRIYRLGLDGSVQWQTESSRKPSALPVTGQDRLFVPEEGADLVAYDLATGQRDWRYFTEGLVDALTATESFVYTVDADTISVIDNEAGEEVASNVKPGEEIRSIVATEERLFTVGSSVIGYKGLQEDGGRS